MSDNSAPAIAKAIVLSIYLFALIGLFGVAYFVISNFAPSIC